MRKIMPVLLVLGAIGLLLIVIGCRNQQPAAQQLSQPASPVATTAAATSTQKITLAPDEAACPVLGTVLKKSMMIPVQHNGKTYYLCCQDCVPKFTADPEKYINHPAPFTREMVH